MTKNVKIYNEPGIYDKSSVYSVTINNDEVPVVEFHPSDNLVKSFFEQHNDDMPPDRNFIWKTHYARFSFTGTITVTIHIKTAIKSFSILPSKHGISGITNGSSLAFEISSYKYLVITINDLENLILLADPLEINPPGLQDADVVNILDYGVDNNNNSENTALIQKAIDEISKNPAKSILYFPDGVYKTATLHIKDDVQLYLSGGAVLRSTGRKEDYPEYDPEKSCIDSFFIKSAGAVRWKIFGRGVIDPWALSTTDGRRVKKVWDLSLKLFGIWADRADSASVEGVLIREATAWAVNFNRSSNIHIRHTKTLSFPLLVHSDGIHLAGCHNALVEDCFTHSGDDAFVVTPRHEKSDNHNIIFRNCVAGWVNTNMIRIGWWPHSDTYDVRFTHIYGCKVHSGISICIYENQSFDVHGVHLSDISIDEFIPETLDIVHGWEPMCPLNIWIRSIGFGNPIANIRDIEIIRFSSPEARGLSTFFGATNRSRIYGFSPGSMVRNVTFTDTHIGGRLILNENARENGINVNEFVSNINFVQSGKPMTRWPEAYPDDKYVTIISKTKNRFLSDSGHEYTRLSTNSGIASDWTFEEIPGDRVKFIKNRKTGRYLKLPEKCLDNHLFELVDSCLKESLMDNSLAHWKTEFADGLRKIRNVNADCDGLFCLLT
ncbi:MAG: hypothetical protein JW969_10005 [Spirochaetales bacterium]|nr:hypothetical protein [Spirochaetales bacterium]